MARDLKFIYEIKAGDQSRLLADGSLLVVNPDKLPFIITADGKRHEVEPQLTCDIQNVRYVAINQEIHYFEFAELQDSDNFNARR